ncbi:MAG: OmpH family outer membrane protein [Bacteroidales bacterium]|nr:OmpH family outer membrane protein [Bacteroidales bacterium]
MKKLFLILTLALMSASMLQAQSQKIGFINTETVLKELPEYQNAQKSLEQLTEKYKAEIEADLKVIDQLYSTYQNQKAYLSSSQRSSAENKIITKEQEMKKKEDGYFGSEGVLSKKSEELLTPIREKVEAAIRHYSELHGFTAIIDLAGSGNIVYYDSALDITKEIIKQL